MRRRRGRWWLGVLAAALALAPAQPTFARQPQARPAQSAPRPQPRPRPPAWLTVDARTPAPVHVYVNGRHLGRTPIRRASVRPGKASFEAVRRDGARVKRVLQLRPGQDAKVVLAN